MKYTKQKIESNILHLQSIGKKIDIMELPKLIVVRYEDNVSYFTEIYELMGNDEYVLLEESIYTKILSHLLFNRPDEYVYQTFFNTYDFNYLKQFNINFDYYIIDKTTSNNIRLYEYVLTNIRYEF